MAREKSRCRETGLGGRRLHSHPGRTREGSGDLAPQIKRARWWESQGRIGEKRRG